MDTHAIVQIGDERARVYVAGGIGFDKRVRGIGWVISDRPSLLIARLAKRLSPAVQNPAGRVPAEED